MKMILEEKEIKKHALEKEIGKPIKSSLKNLKQIGTGSLFLKSFKVKEDQKQPLQIDSRCNLQLFENGILIRSNFSNKINAVAINWNDLTQIKLIRGKEMVNPFPLSPMWILLKMNVPVRIARHFQIYILSEYRIKEMMLKIDTIDYSMEFTSGGYHFEKQQRFFENINSSSKITIDLNQ